jgi:mono/diheme cytochrome c family protein
MADSQLSKEAVFVLPKKHESLLTREEEQGKKLYIYYCSLCHGLTGNSDGFNSTSLSILPTKHNDTDYMETLSDDYIQKIIRKGGPTLGRSPLMPPWGNVIRDAEVLSITAFVRTLSIPKP